MTTQKKSPVLNSLPGDDGTEEETEMSMNSFFNIPGRIKPQKIQPNINSQLASKIEL